MPAEGCIDTSNLNISPDDLKELFRLDKKFWLNEAGEIKKYFDENVNDSTPDEVYDQIDGLLNRVSDMN